MSSHVSRLAAGLVLALAAGSVTLVAEAATASAAPAYNFPFNGRCGDPFYFDGPSQTGATRDHRDGNTWWYRIDWGGSPVDPSNPLSPSNWSSCNV